MTNLATVTSRGMDFSNLDSAMRYAEIIAKTNFCPKGYQGRPCDIVIAIQLGLEVGLQPLQSLNDIAVINGRPTVWGDSMLAICYASGELEYCNESFDEKTKTALCVVKRKHYPEISKSFSMEQAKKANLSSKAIWNSYPERMLQMRARGFALRDSFPDRLKGIISREEAEDYNATTINVTPIAQAVKAKIENIEHVVINKEVDLAKSVYSPKELKDHWDSLPKGHLVCQMSEEDMKEIEKISDETYQILINAILDYEIPTDVTSKWLERAKCEGMKDLTENQAQKCIAYINEKYKKDVQDANSLS